MREVFVGEPARPIGFYWIKRHGGPWVPAEYGAYTSEELEESYFGDHPDEDDAAVFGYGWTLDHSDDNDVRVYFDKDLSAIGRLNPGGPGLMPRTMTAEREAYWRKTVEHLGRAPEQLLAELDAERAESQRLQSRVEALEGALKPLDYFCDPVPDRSDSCSMTFYHTLGDMRRAHAALYPEPAAGNPEPAADP